MSDQNSISLIRKLTTFQLEWTVTGITKSDMFALESEKNCCVAVKYSARLGRYILYFIYWSRGSPSFKIIDVHLSTLKSATRVPMIAVSQNFLQVFHYELVDWKMPVTCTFWVSVNETVDTYRYEIVDKLMGHQLWQAANDKVFTDVDFHVAGQVFSAHKAVLAARSPVFQAMFQNDMVESRTNQATIQDIDAPVFESLLFFIYTGKLDSESNHEELFLAADKYQVDTLKQLCQPPPRDVDALDVVNLLLSI